MMQASADSTDIKKLRVAIASDHAGFEQKTRLVAFLRGQGLDVIDCGPEDDSRVDYPDFATKVAYAVVGGQADRGILVCGTGIGMAIAANKIAGIRAANVITPQMAALARQHNDANVVSVSGRFIDPDVNEQIVTTFLSTDFEGGRHSLRVEKIDALD